MIIQEVREKITSHAEILSKLLSLIEQWERMTNETMEKIQNILPKKNE